MFHKQFIRPFAIIVFGNFFLAYCHTVNVDQFLSELPQNEREGLEVFFRHLIAVSDFGYTLFGTKPVSMDAWSNEPSLAYLFFPVMNSETTLKKGWTLWSKYSHLFHGETFFLRKSSHFGSSTAIYLVNKVAANIIINKNLDTFKNYLGRDVTTSEILKGLENDPAIVDDTLSGNEVLLGILLGYGTMNAQKFQSYNELTYIKNKIPTFPKKIYVLDTDNPWERKIQRLQWTHQSQVKNSGPVDIQPDVVANQLKSMKWERSSENNDLLAQVSLPSFRRIPGDRESEQLMQVYRMTRPKIVAILNSPDFLKKVLSEINK